MSEELREFNADFVGRVMAGAQAQGVSPSESFFAEVCGDLRDGGELTDDVKYAFWQQREGNLRTELAGWDYDDEREILTLIVARFFPDEDVQTLRKDDALAWLKWAQRFFERSTRRLHEDIDETSDAHEAAREMFGLWQNTNAKESPKIKTLRVMLISNGETSAQFKNEIKKSGLGKFEFGGIAGEYAVLDVAFLYNQFISQTATADFVVDEFGDAKVTALPVDSCEGYESYLAAVDALTLARIYARLGARILERKIRAFLSYKHSVNKGIRNTITYSPERFFAYNNGIVAVASGVELEWRKLRKIHNFQIVNGAQTISVIYDQFKNGGESGDNLAGVFVPMKLCVIAKDTAQDELIEQITKCANMQNGVKDADFYATHPFHKEFKEHSKRVFTPAGRGSTHWFYERMRNEYTTAKNIATRKFEFERNNPLKQKIIKADVAKIFVAWAKKPHFVVSGQKKCFDEFAKILDERCGERGEKTQNFVTEVLFKECVAWLIIWRCLGSIVSHAPWYKGGRAQVVAYSAAYLAHWLAKNNAQLNWRAVWDEQEVGGELGAGLALIAQQVSAHITCPPAGITPQQWWKKQACWTAVSELDFGLELGGEVLASDYDRAISQGEARDEKRARREIGEIEKMNFVYKWGAEKWRALRDYYARDKFDGFTPQQQDLLEQIANGSLKIQNYDKMLKQCAILYDLWMQASKEGWVAE